MDAWRGSMRRLCTLGLTFFLMTGMALASQKGDNKGKTFVGNISDSMCGAKHMMSGGDKACTLECVKGGSKYILVDPATGKIYDLNDQIKPEGFAGQKVKVTGTLKGKSIEVTSIEAAQ
jgi:hypothetical protein